MSDDRAKKLGRMFKTTRFKLGMTQQDMAAKAGLNISHYAKVERGELKASLETLEKISKVLKLKLSDLL